MRTPRLEIEYCTQCRWLWSRKEQEGFPDLAVLNSWCATGWRRIGRWATPIASTQPTPEDNRAFSAA